MTYSKWSKATKAQNIKDVLRNIIKWKNMNKSEIDDFINFKINPHDPFLLTNMDKAVERINNAIKNDEKIMIIGDYDCDGICATAILYIGLTHLSANVSWQIPDRFKDGYGVNKRIIDHAKNENSNLIITVDNGISAHDEVEYANKLGIDVIITDHHQFTHPERILPAEITVNPQIDDNYPFKGIAGCMVAFKIIKALIPNIKDNHKDLYNEFLEIAAIGTVADVMELIDENRFYVKYGLDLLSNPKNIGLKMLMVNLKLFGRDISSTDVGFSIGPCINAAGRMGSPDDALKLLLSDDEVEASELSIKLIELNEERKSIQNNVISNLDIDDNDNFIIVTLDDVGHGILGIIAGQIAEKYKKPCFVLAKSGEKLSGSGRSVYSFDINNVIQNNRDIAEGGGHALACGIKLNHDDLDEFKSRCNKHFTQWLNDTPADDLMALVDVVCEIDFNLIGERLINNINRLKPFGNGNDSPIFITKDVKIDSYRIVGKNKNVVQVELSQNGNKAKGVGFSDVLNKFNKQIQSQYIDIAYNLEFNEWPIGTLTPQIIIRDLKAKA